MCSALNMMKQVCVLVGERKVRVCYILLHNLKNFNDSIDRIHGVAI